MATADTVSYPGVPLKLAKANSFRLLEVLRGSFDDPVVVRIFESDLGEDSKYEALSYAWGDPSITQAIQIQHPWTSSTTDTLPPPPVTTSFEVTVSCCNALRRLRSATEGRVLWIDAICIDQHSIPEKTHQLGIMAQIYSRASRVVIYLGEAADGSDAAMDWINELDGPSDYGGGRDAAGRQQPGGDVIRAFLGRPWFHRIWVLQEVAHATSATVYCGAKEASWEALQNFKQWGISTRLFSKNPFARRMRNGFHDLPAALRGSIDTHWGPFSYRLMRKLLETRHCQASDPRDKLFAVVPLLDLETKLAVERRDWWLADPEQQQNDRRRLAERNILGYHLSVADVFTELSLYLRENLGLPAVLEEAGGLHQVPGLPSWALRWDMQRGPRTVADPRHYMPRGSQEWPSPWPEDEGLASSASLRETVASLGVVTAVGDRCDVGQDRFPLAQWRRLVKKHKPEHLTAAFSSQGTRRSWLSAFTVLLLHDGGAVYDEPIMRVLHAVWDYYGSEEEGADFVEMEEFPDGGHSWSWRRDEEGPSTAGEAVAKRSLVAALTPLVADGGSYGEAARRIIDACDGHRLLLTDTGLMGLAVNDAEVGDVLYADPKLQRAFAFRRRGGENASPRDGVTLVGDCYVHHASRANKWRRFDDGDAEVRGLVERLKKEDKERYSKLEDIVIW